MAGIGGHLVKAHKAENDKWTSLLGSIINGAVTVGILRGYRPSGLHRAKSRGLG